MEDMKTVKNVECIIEKELRKIADKGTLSPTEMDVVHKAVETLEKAAKLEKLHEEIKLMKEHPEQYSGAYHGGVHGYPHHMSHPSIPHASYGYNMEWCGTAYPAASEYNGMHSGAQHRSPTTGRYVSGEYLNQDHYSGHSINDRMVAQLEKMMDTAKTDYEKQQILDKIKMIRNSSDSLR